MDAGSLPVQNGAQPWGSLPVAKRARADTTTGLTTILDLVRYAATRFNEAELVFGQGTDDAVDDATLLICEALRLPPDRFDGFLSAHVTAAERQAILRLIAKRVRTRLPVAYLV